jgi:hypothetical protein
MSDGVSAVERLNFNPDDPSLLCAEELSIPVWLGTTTMHPGTDYPGPSPKPYPGTTGRPRGVDGYEADEPLRADATDHRARRGQQKLQPLDIDLEVVSPTREPAAT